MTLSLERMYKIPVHDMKRVTTRPYPNLKTWREAAGLSQREAADLLSISQTYYGRLERGEQVVVRDAAKRIIDLTGVPLETLVGLAS